MTRIGSVSSKPWPGEILRQPEAVKPDQLCAHLPLAFCANPAPAEVEFAGFDDLDQREFAERRSFQSVGFIEDDLVPGIGLSGGVEGGTAQHIQERLAAKAGGRENDHGMVFVPDPGREDVPLRDGHRGAFRDTAAL